MYFLGGSNRSARACSACGDGALHLALYAWPGQQRKGYHWIASRVINVTYVVAHMLQLVERSSIGVVYGQAVHVPAVRIWHVLMKLRVVTEP